RVRFCYAPALVQLLQQEKQEWRLHQQLQKLDRFDLLVLDDLGYVKKRCSFGEYSPNRERTRETEAETSVLFELIAHRYERRSLLLTANQPFSRWDSIFSDSMMTVAAVDRLIHHAVIVEVDAESFRKQAATRRNSSSRSAVTDP
ncbi:MAG: ATP-binding protein, partial [Cyanobacteria bacterium J06641_5]